MKRIVLSLSLALILAGAASAAEPEIASEPVPAASEPASEVAAAPPSQSAQGALPQGAVVRTDDANLAYMRKSNFQAPADLTVFRPSENMPELSREFLVENVTGLSNVDLIGHMPRLKVLPCPKGCNGSSYEKTVAKFVRGYDSAVSTNKAQYRGEMTVQVRWFHEKMLFVPLSVNNFGISFVYEGKLISLGKTSASRSTTQVGALAEEVGQRLAFDMLFRAGAGIRPTFLKALDADSATGSAAIALGSGLAAVQSLTGADDARSRIEPASTETHKHLLPAVDGIAPGEYKPINEAKFIPNL